MHLSDGNAQADPIDEPGFDTACPIRAAASHSRQDYGNYAARHHLEKAIRAAETVPPIKSPSRNRPSLRTSTMRPINTFGKRSNVACGKDEFDGIDFRVGAQQCSRRPPDAETQLLPAHRHRRSSAHPRTTDRPLSPLGAALHLTTAHSSRRCERPGILGHCRALDPHDPVNVELIRRNKIYDRSGVGTDRHMQPLP